MLGTPVSTSPRGWSVRVGAAPSPVPAASVLAPEGPALTVPHRPACRQTLLGRTVVTAGTALWLPFGAWPGRWAEAAWAPCLSCVPSPPGPGSWQQGVAGRHHLLFGASRGPCGQVCPGSCPEVAPPWPFPPGPRRQSAPSWVQGAEGPSAGGPEVQRLVGAPHPSLRRSPLDLEELLLPRAGGSLTPSLGDWPRRAGGLPARAQCAALLFLWLLGGS